MLLSTYELGRQPFGLASPAAWLRRAGFDVLAQDLSRQRLDDPAVRAADVIAFYMPMHTATRLALPVVDRVRHLNPAARLCAFGLYAPPNAGVLRQHGVAATFGAEFEADLVAYVRGGGDPAPAVFSAEPVADPAASANHDGPATGSAGPDLRGESGRAHSTPSIARLEFVVPDRAGLPELARYASLQRGDVRTVVGYTEASRGCLSLCRHCPVVPVYRGQFRVVPTDVVLADIRNQIAAGAAHITFGDPDFFNGPTHARRVVTALHEAYPSITYDVTIKIEHLLRHQSLLDVLRETGCLFVTTAAESFDDRVLAALDKGHAAADIDRAVTLCRQHGLDVMPTFVPFTPWTTLESYIDLLAGIRRLSLIDHVAPIQLGIRLLIPGGSRLLELPDVRGMIGPFDPTALAHPWVHHDGRIDVLQREVVETVGRHVGASRADLFGSVWQLACEVAGVDPAAGSCPSVPDSGYQRTSVPFLNEPWYC